MKLTARQLRAIDPPRETDVPPFPVRKFTVREYHQLLQVGILKSGALYELLRGWIVPKVKRSPAECFAISGLCDEWRRLIPSGATFVRLQQPITFSDSEPEPAGAIVCGKVRDFAERHPHPREIELVAEVAGPTLERDRTCKLGVYASGRIPAYWIVNIGERIVEVYTDPKGGKNPTYRTRTDYTANDSVPVVVAGTTLGSIAVKDLLPTESNRTEAQ